MFVVLIERAGGEAPVRSGGASVSQRGAAGFEVSGGYFGGPLGALGRLGMGWHGRGPSWGILL